MSDQWTHKDEWEREGRNFMVKVSRHTQRRYDPTEGSNNWCIYAYIYPKHPDFAKFDVDGPMYQDAAAAMPLHGGPTFFQAHYDRKKNECTSVQVGADYNHLYDDEFAHHKTLEDAYQVFNDAGELFDWLEARDPKEPQP